MAIPATVAVLVLLLLGTSSQVALAQQQNQLETPRLTERDQRREFLAGADSPFKFRFAAATGAAKVDNPAVLQLQVDKAGNPFLSTLPPPGMAQFLTALKPCGNLLPHNHPRATEFYSVLYGEMKAGESQENGGLQNITLSVLPGEVFVAVQGLLHFNHNPSCTPLVFVQSFNSADPGALNIIGALAALNGGGPIGAAGIKASNAGTITASPQGAFSLDQDCLARCGLPSTGAPGDGLGGLPNEFRVLFGLAAV
ncbi:hypothetical protein WJX72_002380 [[Myrmecia] bisecta]|uniref:Germin-like protein n=1 Tax=[Myrmecia] bisecta TaxID=41462 RepID=A0AAW1PFI6_9CHLO